MGSRKFLCPHKLGAEGHFAYSQWAKQYWTDTKKPTKDKAKPPGTKPQEGGPLKATSLSLRYKQLSGSSGPACQPVFTLQSEGSLTLPWKSPTAVTSRNHVAVTVWISVTPSRETYPPWENVFLIALKRASRCLNFLDPKISIQDLRIATAFYSGHKHYIFITLKTTQHFWGLANW